MVRISNSYHKISTSKYRKEPRLDEIDDVWVLMNSTIIHYLQSWVQEKVALIKCAFNECVEGCTVNGTFNEVTIHQENLKKT